MCVRKWFVVFLGLLIFAANSLSAAEIPSQRPEDGILVFDLGEMFTSEQEELLQKKASKILKENNQPVAVLTLEEHDSNNGLLYAAKCVLNKWWPPLMTSYERLQILEKGVIPEKPDEWRKKMHQPNVLLMIFDASTGEAGVEITADRASPDDHERKFLLRKYVLPLVANGKSFEAASLGLDAIEAKLSNKSLPSEPATRKSRLKLLAALILVVLILCGFLGKGKSSGPFYYFGYIFSIFGMIFGSLLFIFGLSHNRTHGSGTSMKDREAVKNMRGAFKS